MHAIMQVSDQIGRLVDVNVLLGEMLSRGSSVERSHNQRHAEQHLGPGWLARTVAGGSSWQLCEDGSWYPRIGVASGRRCLARDRIFVVNGGCPYR